MTGIYIHIPFCRQACRYCDFYFTVSLGFVDSFLEALKKEITMKGEEAGNIKISTLYFGGGTPSILSPEQLSSIVELIRKVYDADQLAEVTLETNPDDLSPEYLHAIRNTGFNRISIGVQSFFREDLELMRRSHTADQAKYAVMCAYDAGFRNITLDLIYGIPGLTARKWELNLQRAFSLPVQHLSAYHLTFEPGTVFGHWQKKGRLNPLHESESIEQYRMLREMAGKNEFVHYEISNFAKKGFMSMHNMIYWKRNDYIGMGPSAHSYDGHMRRWNTPSLRNYISAIATGKPWYETEIPDEIERYHDYLITALRTFEGADKNYIKSSFSNEIVQHFEKTAMKFVASGQMVENGHTVRMTPESWFISDHLLRELFV